MPFLPVGDSKLYYEVYGSGPPVILAHGGVANHISFWQTIPTLAKRYTVITFDHRGFGLSTDEGGDGLKYAVDDLEALVEHLGIERAAFLGQSLGGFTVGGLVSRRPDLFHSLILTSSNGGFNQISLPKGAETLPSSYRELAKKLVGRDHFPTRYPELCFLFERLGGLNRSVSIEFARQLQATKNDLSVVIENEIPLMLINGDHDTGIVKRMYEIHEAVAGSEIYIVEDAGHLLYFEQPAIYNDHVIRFLRKTMADCPPAQIAAEKIEDN